MHYQLPVLQINSAVLPCVHHGQLKMLVGIDRSLDTATSPGSRQNIRVRFRLETRTSNFPFPPFVTGKAKSTLHSLCERGGIAASKLNPTVRRTGVVTPRGASPAQIFPD